ncbi:hypothetical protein [Nocardia sp. alder85J]|uniref:hypothetical protein n=1 Tax=Nocardia sp. alder85J TaxID=2862949 RepID=UPI001CD49D82|nr:hypothetical protein [Nocardia sp. alder85J]MCX4096170.1 hypothetical protein [Nocardia sp. alder85J]
MNFALPRWVRSIGSWFGDAWDWLLHVRADAWAATAGWATAAIALGTVVVAGIYVRKQVRAALDQADEARKTREEQAQPNVTIFMDHNPADWDFLELVIKNFGATPAHNVRVMISPKTMSHMDVICFRCTGIGCAA